MTATVDAPDLWTDPTASGEAVAALAATRATTFMRAQAGWVQRGLDSGDDRIVVDLVIATHDQSHDRWVRVFNHVSTHLGEEAGQEVAAVYRCVGRTVGSLEQRAFGLLDTDIATKARHVLAENLAGTTERAIENLWRIAAER